MAELPASYDDLFGLADHRLRNRIALFVGGAIVVAGAAFAVWTFFFSGGGATQAQAQTATADRGNVTKSVTTSGVVAADQTTSLSFQQSGKVTAVLATIGQKVKQGDVLAQVDATDLQSALDTANLNLAAAQLKLKVLLQGSTASQLAAADQSLVQAQANYDKAVRAFNALQEPATPTDLASAQQAVTAAQAQLSKAQQSRSDVDTNSNDAIAKAQAAVDKAQSALDKASSTSTTADAAASSAEAALFTAESSYCPDAGVSFCGSHSAPLSSSDQNALVSVTDSGPPDRAQLANKLLSANTAYAKALSDQQTADDAVQSANADLQTAQDALAKAQLGPTPADVESADSAVSGAQVALAGAQDKVNKLTAGPTSDQLNQAQDDIDTAAASVRSAQAKRDETYSGSLPTDVQQQQQSVAQQQLAADKAKRDLDKAKIVAPFDGTVAVVNIQVGDNSGSGSSGSAGTSGNASASSSGGAAIVLNTPDAVRVDLTVSETDLPNVKAGQNGVALFDAIANRPFPIVIDSIGTNPTTTQGVVTYAARAHIATGQAATVGPARTANAAPATDAKPAPGMNARITIITDQRQNVVRVASAAIQRQGSNSSVQVKTPNGTQTVNVQTGLSDATNTEITDGIDEGAVVVIPTRAASGTQSTGTTAGAGTGTGGGGGAGGFRFGGGGGAGGGGAGRTGGD